MSGGDVGPFTRGPRRLALIGLAGCAAALLLVAADPATALAGWLTGVVFWTSAPIGALPLLMMIRLIPGAWGDELSAPTEAAVMLLPLALLVILPVLLAPGVLYEWTAGTGEGGFRAVYLTTWFFVLRTAVFFACMGILAFLLLFRRAWSVPVSAAGLIVFVLLDTTMAIDWLMSLEPEFHSSGFGLYVLSIQMTIALAFLTVVRLLSGEPYERAGVLGALLLCALLLWAYFAFMQYIIIWSGNFPSGVLWYQHRGTGIWGLVEYAVAILHLGPTFLLFFPPIRRSGRWLVALSLVVLVGKALEVAWLVLPAIGIVWPVAVPATLLAFIGLGALSAAGLAGARRWLAGPSALPGPANREALR